MSESTIVVELLADGTLRLNTHPLERRDVNAELSRIFAARANKVLFLKADQKLEYHQVALLIDLVKGVHPAVQVGLLTPGSNERN